MEIVLIYWLIFWLLCGVVCYFIMKSKGYPNNTCLAHGVGGALLGIIWIIVVLCKENCGESTSTSQLSDMELLSKMLDLKERGAITEAEFEEKKREILNNVKKNDESIVQTCTLRRITICLFLATFIICGISWFLYESDLVQSGLLVSYGNFMLQITLSDFAMAIVSLIMVIILILKTDIRILCIPIIAESLLWFRMTYNIIKNISEYKNFTILTYSYVFCAISTILLLITIFFPSKGGANQQPILLYVIPGICRAMYSISWFMLSNYSPLHVNEYKSIYSWFQFLGRERAILSIAYILLGILIRQLVDEKRTNNTVVL